MPELADMVALEGEDVLSVRRWTGQNGSKLAAATGSNFTPGKGKRPGLFAGAK